ncbi:MAG: sulfotransferase domain-containing protein [Planctomycetota bacterium]
MSWLQRLLPVRQAAATKLAATAAAAAADEAALQARQGLDDIKAALAQKDWPAVVAGCRRVLVHRRDLPHVYAWLADGLTIDHDYWHNPELCARLLADGTLREAIASWEKAIALGHVNDWSYLGLGHALTLTGDLDRAAHFLRLATDLRIQIDFPEHFARHGSSGSRRGPDFLVIGATKCGTTSLYEYMRQHPQVLPAVWKEIEYFRFPDRTRDWYLAHFPRMPDGPVRFLSGEASSCYLSLFDAKARVRAEFPDSKLIAIVRDPVDRTISHVHHDRKLCGEARSVEAALTRELDLLERLADPWRDADEYWRTERGYVWLSLYGYFLENWLTVFPKEQLLVLFSEDLFARPAATLSRVFEFVGLRDHALPKYDVFLKGEYDKNRSDPLRARLARFFAPHNERLERLLGRKLDWQRP